jgi:hypothetical protein
MLDHRINYEFFYYRLPDKDFGLRLGWTLGSESSTTYLSVRLTRIPPSGLAKIII